MTAPANNQENESAKPIGEGKTNTRQGSVIPLHVEPSALLFLNLHTGELLEVPKAEAVAFENECRRMQFIAQNYLDANDKLALAYDDLSRIMATPMPALTERQQAEEAVKKAKKEQEAAHQELRAEIEPLGKINERDVKLMELIPLVARTSGGIPVHGPDGKPAKRITGFKTVYVRSDKVKSHWRTYKLSKADVQSGHESILRKDANGRTKIDTDKLMGQIKEAKVKASWLNTILDEKSIPKISETLTDWAEAWNKDLKWNREVKLGPLKNDVSLTAQAQLMRFFAGVGGDAEWEPHKGRVALKAEGRVEFAVAEGTAGCQLFLPSKKGWDLCLTDLTGKRHDIGPMRFSAHLRLYGAAGASVVGELALTTDFKDAKKGEWGIRGTPRAKGAGGKSDELDLSAKPKDPAAVAELEAFAGAQADISLKGSLEWLHPQETGAKFEPFASVAPAIGAQAGLGAGGYMELSYIDGKFRFRAKAAACLGVGAKGRLELEVDAKQIWSFVKWFFYALYHANYNNLTFVSERTFEAINRLYVMSILQKTELERVMQEMIDEVRVGRAFDAVLQTLEREEYRVQLMNSVLSRPQLLLYSPPETRGMLLYQLTRHSPIAKADLRNWDSFEVMSRRKRAVVAIIKTIQTSRDYENTLQHMHPKGVKSGTWNASEDHIMRFLEIGLGNSSLDDEVREYVRKMRSKALVLDLHKGPARGYRVAYNDTMQYLVQAGDHPLFACGGAIETANDNSGVAAA